VERGTFRVFFFFWSSMVHYAYNKKQPFRETGLRTAVRLKTGRRKL